MKNKLGLLLQIILLPALIFATCGFMDFFFDLAHGGNEAFERGKYDQASKYYTEAQIKDPTNARLDYNLGAALYKQGKLDDALAAFGKAAKSGDANLAADAHYSSGNAHFQKGKLQEAITEYTEALKLRPDDEDAKYNLELARRLLQQRQDQDQKDKQNQNQQQQGEDQQQQDQQQQGQDQQDQQGQQDQKQGEEKKQQQQDKKQGQGENKEGEDQKDQEAQAAGEEAEGKELTEEEAARILDSLKKEEKDELAKQILPSSGVRTIDKDW